MPAAPSIRRWPALLLLLLLSLAAALWFGWPKKSEPLPFAPARTGELKANDTRVEERRTAVVATPAANVDVPFFDAGSAAPPDAGWDAGVSRAEAQAAVDDWLDANAAAARDQLDRFCEQSALLKGTVLVPPRVRVSDAAYFMGVRVGFERAERPPGLLMLPKDVSARLQSYGAEWPSRIAPTDLRGLDFAWMRQAMEFDHWTLTSDGPSRSAEPKTLWEESTPNYFVLLEWSKLRLAAGLANGDVGQASKEVRHLASLVHSQDILLAQMFSLSLIGVDQNARRAAESRGIDVTGWPSVREEDRATASGLIISGYGFLVPKVPPELQRKAIECSNAPCAGIVEAIALHAALGGFVSGSADSLSDAAKRHGCDLALVGRASRTPQLDSAGAHSMKDSPLPVRFKLSRPVNAQ